MNNALDADFLIFDLGNVIIDLDYSKALQRIKEEVSFEFYEKVDGFYLTDFHKDYEIGIIDSGQFRDAVRSYFQQSWTDEKVDELWNCLLLKIPLNRLKLISKLRENFQVGVLSNTNLIHIHAVNRILQQDHGLENFDPIFDWVFLSHEMGLAKPNIEIYEKMLVDLDTSAGRVIFFDDLFANVEGARAVGIQAVHVTGPEVIFEYFKNV
ncbi:putative hydrolase of the HAD superfamily [Algoriphagus ratkowskyi]|uniref:HAD family phosphatase n=1 Tax=Algoriphagus ratkowskyi TaxID=57028 RepID=A0A2W7R9V9_9BACT|nr:HAD family phosphatase [Algoriphagus ratkowskyi]PZX52467.1 putative hydrolase of the HAD superfamily [Algoriphagus ratkowskyi]TXD76189.1 HAD family phosphatase [Algoriphagus ratkowskyi]